MWRGKDEGNQVMAEAAVSMSLHQRRTVFAAPLFVACILVPPAARAQESVYTRHVWAKCAPVSKEDDNVLVTRCQGYGGIPVWYGLGDHGGRVTFGGIKAFGDPPQGPWPAPGATVEWRGRKGVGGRFEPYAAIVGYTLTENPLDKRSKRTRALTVHRVAAGRNGCFVAIVYAERGKDVNVEARRIADAQGAGFRCGGW
jgi:hypothetical protein